MAKRTLSEREGAGEATEVWTIVEEEVFENI
jgi:hypothetical protein